MSFAVHFIRQGRTRDPECSRSSHRLSVAWKLLEAGGVEPTTASADAINKAWALADQLISDKAAVHHTAIWEAQAARR